MKCIISFVSLAIVISMSLFTFKTEMDTFLLIFHIPIAVKSFKSTTIGIYFCSVQKKNLKESSVEIHMI